jgi:ABC-type antimicrobial peptide transport system permease subunit
VAGGALRPRSCRLAAAIRSRIHDLDAGLPIFIETWKKGMDGALFTSRVATVSLGVLGAMGAMLSITGIFGMAAYSVSKRLRELGIRMALGAQRREVLRADWDAPLKLLVLGSAAGLALGVLASRVLAAIVYQATPRDPLVLAGAVLAMLLLGSAGHLDSRPARSFARSGDAAARRVNRPEGRHSAMAY